MTMAYIKEIVKAARESKGRCFIAGTVRTSKSNMTGYVKVYYIDGTTLNVNEISGYFDGFRESTGEIKVTGYGFNRAFDAIYRFLMQQGLDSQESLTLAGGYQRL